MTGWDRTFSSPFTLHVHLVFTSTILHQNSMYTTLTITCTSRVYCIVVRVRIMTIFTCRKSYSHKGHQMNFEFDKQNSRQSTPAGHSGIRPLQINYLFLIPLCFPPASIFQLCQFVFIWRMLRRVDLDLWPLALGLGSWRLLLLQYMVSLQSSS